MPSTREIPISSIDNPLRVGGKWFRSGEESCLIKAVTFGPFPAGAFPDEGTGQLSRIREELGANALRLYEIPSLEFLHACASEGLRVFITLPWAQHVDFLKQSHVLDEAERLLCDTVMKFRGHPAVAGYFVANEIDSVLMRWMGAARVVEKIEELIDLGHAYDPDTLFAYANYPSTEYLLPQNQDFLAFNLYLEDRNALASYLDRLQNLAGGKPLFLSEFGVDSTSHGEEGQAEILQWMTETSVTAGVAGVTVFAWSDLWRRGGRAVEGWTFGLTRSDGSSKLALGTLHDAWGRFSHSADGIALEKIEKVSVIVCTYYGSATLVECLDSLAAIDYPDFEVLVVNDGADHRVTEIAKSYPEVRCIDVEHVGLGAARNLGAKEARGDIFVYLDDDCVVEPDWLRWIVWQFASDPTIACAGGPNLPPLPKSRTMARIAAAPGGPSHVLLNDRHAEHLPGCNLAVTRSAFEEIGGFNPIFRTAGDDVDFCWRILSAGYKLGFHAAAFVWHHRRFTYRAYFRQQIGYGRAEALLMPLHPDRFRGLDGALWEGQVYVTRRRFGAFVYHGHYGYEPFQLMYPGADSWFGEVAIHIAWWAVMLAFAVGGLFYAPFFLPAGIMLFGTLYVAIGRAGRSAVAPRFDTTNSRLILIPLVIAQGFLRSGTRLLYGWRHATWGHSLRIVGGNAADTLSKAWWKLGDDLAFWSNEGVGREELLTAVLHDFRRAEDDATGKTDIVFRKGWFWNWAIVTATEYHEDKGRLTHLRILARPLRTMKVIALLVIFVGPWVAMLSGLSAGMVLGGGPVIALTAWALSRLMLWTKHPRFRRVAKSIGLRPV